MELSKERVMEIVRDNMDNIREFGANRIGLFGSVARGEIRDDSDIDLIVEFDEGMVTLQIL